MKQEDNVENGDSQCKELSKEHSKLTARSKAWIPLEINPEVMNGLQKNLGISSKYSWTDIVSFSEDMLDFVPQPVYAVIFLFPVTCFDNKNILDFKKGPSTVMDNNEELKATIDENLVNNKANWPFFVKQTISNACGMMALIHSLSNIMDRIEYDKNGLLPKFISQGRDLDINQRAVLLENSEEFEKVHEISAKQGQTVSPDANAQTDLHFISLIEHLGHVWVLDGRENQPVPYFKITSKGFLHTAAALCSLWIEKNPDIYDCGAIALIE